MEYPDTLSVLANDLKTNGEAFAVATVVRTVSVTAAKPGAKAILSEDGLVLSGWIGGGCAKGAVASAARSAIADGQPRLVQLQPEDLLKEQGLVAGDETDGVLVARNLCPSQGTMDIFVEPVLSNPELLVLGASPIALALVQQAAPYGFRVRASDNGNKPMSSAQLAVDPSGVYGTFSEIPREHAHRYIVIATQGSGDLDAIVAALAMQARHLAFVGSRRKLTHLRGELMKSAYDQTDCDRVCGPAGLDIGAVTPQEIALSILAEVIRLRRR